MLTTHDNTWYNCQLIGGLAMHTAQWPSSVYVYVGVGVRVND